MEIQKSLISLKNAGSCSRMTLLPMRYKFLHFVLEESVIAVLNDFPTIEQQDKEIDLPESIPLSDM